MTRSKKRVLFICTANYYRSRFAEAVFNHHAMRERMPWRAYSRGFATYLVNQDISYNTAVALQDRNIDLSHTSATASQLTEVDLENCDLAIALSSEEHRPEIDQLYPEWVDRIRYWEIPDMDKIPPNEALPMVEEKTLELLAELQQQEA
jgi:protein-tyrosine phosphatase